MKDKKIVLETGLGVVALRLKLVPSLVAPSTKTLLGVTPCFRRVTPVNSVYASPGSLAAISFYQKLVQNIKLTKSSRLTAFPM